MSARSKGSDPSSKLASQAETYRAVLAGELTLGQAVASLRKLSGLTQPQFAKHRGISLQALRQIEQETGNPTVQTLERIAGVFGLRVGFVRAAKRPLVPAGSSSERAASAAN